MVIFVINLGKDYNVNAIRIDYTDLIPFGSRNKGRISIGELNILHL